MKKRETLGSVSLFFLNPWCGESDSMNAVPQAKKAMRCKFSADDTAKAHRLAIEIKKFLLCLTRRFGFERDQ